jgi:predicted acyltransferase
LGYLLYWFPFFHEGKGGGYEFKSIQDTRILGVLQRIALCYGIASLMIYYLSKRAVWILSIIFLGGYWLVMYLCGDYTMTGNVGMALDKAVLGESHMYHGEGIPFEPEGILSTIPSIVNVIIGYYAGLFIRERGNSYETVAKLMIAGATLITLGYFWDLLFPINKKLWTSSFVVYTCGIDILVLGTLMYVIDLRNKKKWTNFFQVFGKNPLFIYLLSEFFVIILFTVRTSKNTSLYHAINKAVYQRILPGAWGSLFFAISVMMFCWVVGWWMDKKKIYVRV